MASSRVPLTAGESDAEARPATTSAAPKTTTPVATVARLFDALLAKEPAAAWAMIANADQVRLGVSQRLVEQFNSMGITEFTITGSSAASVEVEVIQTAKISEIDGVIALGATMRLPIVEDGSGPRVVWTRRMVDQHYPEATPAEDERVKAVVRTWAAEREGCTTIHPAEHRDGLVGVVGLANALCGAKTPVVVTKVGDLEALDEPQPIIEAFGASALLWARVVGVSSPIPMAVVLAPLGSEWIVVAVSRPSLSGV